MLFRRHTVRNPLQLRVSDGGDNNGEPMAGDENPRREL